MNLSPIDGEQNDNTDTSGTRPEMTISECVLSERDQLRNGLIFITCWALVYLVAPVIYVGIVQAAICNTLGTSDTVANLPQAVYMWLMPTPVLIAWLFPSERFLKPLLVLSFFLLGAAGAVVAVMFNIAPREWIATAIIVHAGVTGATNSVSFVCLWELVGRGMTAKRRGKTLGWCYGVGPGLAVLGSFLSQLVLSGNFLDVVRVPLIPEPWRYIILYAATVPTMWLAAFLGSRAVLPPAGPEPATVSRIANIASGIRQYATHPLIMITATAYLLTYVGGNMILPNMALYVREVTDELPETYSGLQMLLRFSFKIAAGFALGWIVTRTHPKAGLLVTTGICLLGVMWALVIPGKWYLLSFGLIGAGELFGVYFPNYIVTCSAPNRIRENVAYTTLLTFAVGFAGGAFGMIADTFGLRTSFVVASAILAVAITLVAIALPNMPSPEPAQRDSPEEVPQG
ncbi:MAG: MFS transporter [Rhodopirellula sp.]|nr:MFS transporter [Rhodopirellula sp.]